MALFHNVYADDFRDLVLLEPILGDIQGQILRVHCSKDNVEVFRYQLITTAQGEHMADF